MAMLHVSLSNECSCYLLSVEIRFLALPSCEQRRLCCEEYAHTLPGKLGARRAYWSDVFVWHTICGMMTVLLQLYLQPLKCILVPSTREALARHYTCFVG